MRPHLKCMHQQVAVVKKLESFCLVSRLPEAIFLLLALVFFDGLAQPSTDRKPAKSRGKEGKRKGKTSSNKGGKFPSFGTLGVLPKPPTSRSKSRPPMSKKRPTDTGTTRGEPHHAPRLRLDQCMLCRQVGHRASECPNKGKATSSSRGKRASGTYAVACTVLDAMCCGATVEESEERQDANGIGDVVAFSTKSL